MIKTGFETRVKVQQIVDGQIPQFILDESPKTSEFLKQYYISQEYQGGVIDVSDNLDQYLKLDNLTPQVISETYTLSDSISSSDTVITVSSTKGFPQNYGLIKIENEIITYTDKTSTSFIGCVRGFSGVTSYSDESNPEDLVFSTSTANSHASGVQVQNLSSLFLKEFYKKLKYSLAPSLQEYDFVSDLNVGNFLKEAKSFYRTKGTEESYRILFNVLYGEDPKVVNLENFLIKPSSSNYKRREVVVAERISGDPLKLIGQSIKKSENSDKFASVSEVEIISRKGLSYYKISLFVGYDDASDVTEVFSVPGKTIVSENCEVGSSIITVDSTIGFPESGTLKSGNNTIAYTKKSVNQFLGCSNIVEQINAGDSIDSGEYVFGYEDGDTTKKVELRLTGVVASFVAESENFSVDEGQEIYVKNLGEIIKNPIDNKTYKQLFANTWTYNTSSRYEVKEVLGSNFVLFDKIEKSSLKVNDQIEIVIRNSNTVVSSSTNIPVVQTIDLNTNSITLGNLSEFSYNANLSYDIRRKYKKAKSTGVNIEFGNNKVLTDVQNLYNKDDEFIYVASNSIPSYTITKNVFKSTISEATPPRIQNYSDLTEKYSVISFSSNVPFITGDRVYYYAESNIIPGLEVGSYYVEVLSEPNKIKLYTSRSFIGSDNYVQFDSLSSGSGNQNFVLYSQKDQVISPQKLLRKFPLTTNIADGLSDDTLSGPIGMLVNGVEISNYKSDDRIYYGPIDSVSILSGGRGYDVVNPPLISVKDTQGSGAKIQPILRGSVEKVLVDPQEIGLDTIVSIALTGGNGNGASFYPVITSTQRQLEFSAKEASNGGGVDVNNETITFLSEHKLNSGDIVIYNSNGNDQLGIASYHQSNTDSGKYLTNDSGYYVKVLNSRTIELYENANDYRVGVNTVGFTTIGNVGVHLFKTGDIKNVLKEINVLDTGSNYENRKLIVNPSSISTVYDTVYFKNHGFNDGDVISYAYETSSIVGLSSEVEYKVLKINSNEFRLCNTGYSDNSSLTDYERKKYISFESSGSGYQYFKYPDIKFSINFSSVGVGTTAKTVGVITATPVIRGEVIDAFVYDGGSNYGSTILNLHRKPSVEIKTGKNAQISPIVVNGRIKKASVQYGGEEYYSEPELVVVGEGNGAQLRPVIEGGKIKDVIVINTGIGYTQSTTSVLVNSSGKNLNIDCNVRFLSVNKNKKFGNEVLDSGLDGVQYSVSAYDAKVQAEFNDTSSTAHSPIIGWAYDGNPIYGPYGYSDIEDSDSSTIILKSGYKLDTLNVINRPSGFAPGFFVEDYRFDGSGDLDEHNGRFCKTPEFPNGVYAYFAAVDTSNVGISSFPYFIGNSYRSKYDSENRFLDQSFDFNNSNLVRNTFPYKIGSQNSSNDFIFESYDYYDQKSIVESVSRSSVDSIEVIDSGSDYKVGEYLEFDSNGTSGGGLRAAISEITGKQITNVNTNITNYSGTITWNDKNRLKVTITPYHEFLNGDNIILSGITSTLSQIKKYQSIGITSFTSRLTADVPSNASAGVVTDIYVSEVPKVSVGSSIRINSELFSVLNLFENENIIRVRRDVGSAHTASSTINFLTDSFTVNEEVDYFDSTINDKIFFNPSESLGIGTAGESYETTFTLGITTTGIATYSRSIPTQSLYLKNHPFKNNQRVLISKPNSSFSSLSISTSTSGTPFNLPSSGNSEYVYVTSKSKNTVGIKTSLESSEVFFVSDPGGNSYEYSIESDFNQISVNIEKIQSTISISTYHGLLSGDLIKLTVNPNQTVGIKTFSSVKLKFDETSQKLLVNTIGFSSSVVNTSSDTLTLTSHELNTGDKVYYNSSDLVSSGLSTGSYYVYKIDDNNIKLTRTKIDSTTNPPNVVSIASTGGLYQEISLINPKLLSVKNNNLVFDVSDSSLQNYDLKFYYDNDFQDDFLSVESTTNFNVSGFGTIGVSTNATVTLNYSDDLPKNIFYTLKSNSGYISTSDFDVTDYSTIEFTNSLYDGNYKVSGVGQTTFNISLRNRPESLSYNNLNCDVLKYNTTSKSSSGGIGKVNIISSGSGYKSLPSFTGVTSSLGINAFVKANSDKVGKVESIDILNQGFEYSSDKTLTPNAYISPSISIKDNYKITSVGISSFGNGYVTPPSIIAIDSVTRKVLDNGLLISSLNGRGLKSIEVVEPVYGATSNEVEIIATNNTNGYSINTIETSGSGIATCYLTTPTLGFTISPFAVGDEIYVEGIVNYSGNGYNSSENGYRFFKVNSFTNVIPAKLEFDISDYNTNPGIAATTQNSIPSIVRKSDYPEFVVVKEYSSFELGERLSVLIDNVYADTDLTILESSNFGIKVFGDYVLSKGDKVKGNKTGTIATISSISNNRGRFNIDYKINKNVGWSDDIGKLDEDYQRVSDNDYYQNLSYTVKSTKDYETLSGTVSNILHTAGLKNFADVQIQEVANSGIKTFSTNETRLYNLISENRVDEVNNFASGVDVDVVDDKSKFIKLQNKKLTSYVECVSNRVLSIDDISSKFSNTGLEVSDQNIIDNLSDSYVGFNRYYVQIKDTKETEFQINEIVSINKDNLNDGINPEIFYLEKSYLSNQDSKIADINVQVFENGEEYLTFNPLDANTKDYDVKILKEKFATDLVGIGSTNIGFVNLLSTISNCGIGSTTSIITLPSADYNSLYFNIFALDLQTKEINYVEIYLNHDGTNTYLSEYYFDSERVTSNFSLNEIGSFESHITNGVLHLDYINDSTNQIKVGAKVIGFGNTSSGIGTYRFNVEDQVDGTEKTALYESNNIISSGISTVFSVLKSQFTSARSVINVSFGSTSALYQLNILNDGQDVYTLNAPILSVGSTTGIGTFGGEYYGNNLDLRFYPDSSLSEDVNIVSFTELVHSDIDSVNIPDVLNYGVSENTLDFIEYGGTNGERVRRLDFDLRHDNYPIFEKTFNPSDVLDLATGIFTIKSHFFNTGEEVLYSAGSTLELVSAVGLNTGSGTLSSTVYPIKLTNDTFRVALTSADADAGIYVTFTSAGSGNSHSFESTKKLEKTIINLDGLVQYPISYTKINYTLTDNLNGSVGVGTTVFALSGISSIKSGDLIKVDNEYMEVLNVGYGETHFGPISGIGNVNLVEVTRGFVGTGETNHTDSTSAYVYRGSYNIEGNRIYFTEPPRGDFRSGSDDSNYPYSLLKSKFNGRVYLRKDYETNQLYDDISESFTGIGATYTLTVNGINTTGLGTDGGNGIVFVNNLFQIPSTQNNTNNNFEIIEDTNVGVSSIVFSGSFADPGEADIISYSDVNQNQLPRGGLIVSLGSTGGLGYAPLVGASVTAVVGAGGSIVSVGIGTTDIVGSGYFGTVSVGVTDPNHTGSAATITASVGAGGTLSFNVVGGGTGYTTPYIQISPPSYSNLPVEGVSRLGVGSTTETGVGLLLNLEVSAASTTGIGSTLFEVSSFSIQRNGYGFNVGDVITPVGLVTSQGIPSPISRFELTVLDTYSDNFAALQFGELDYIDSIKSLQNGTRVRFPIYYNGSLLSFEVDENNQDSVLIDLSSVLLIFVNGILQKPNEAYSFNGGSSFVFATPPRVEDNVAIFFYRGTRDEDSSIVTVKETVKSGDELRLYKNNGISETLNQDYRVINNLTSSDTVETDLYYGEGVDEENLRPISLVKQKVDKLINSEIISKSRDSLETQVYPSARIISDLSTVDTVLYVDDAQFFNYEENESSIVISSVDAIIVNELDRVSANLTATVSAGGTISSITINDGGSGYTGSSIEVKISAPKKVGVGIGTTATATATVTNGSISTPITITNPGFGYTNTSSPQVLVELPASSYENITGIANVTGFSGIVTGISTSVGVGTDLAIKFDLNVSSGSFSGLIAGYPIYVYDTPVGSGLTSIDTSDSQVIGIGTTFVDNVYKIQSITSVGSTNASVICNILSSTDTSELSIFGYQNIGNFSWGRLAGFSRSSTPISISVNGNTATSGLTTYPSMQRRGYGLRDTGSLKKDLG